VAFIIPKKLTLETSDILRRCEGLQTKCGKTAEWTNEPNRERKKVGTVLFKKYQNKTPNILYMSEINTQEELSTFYSD
jgi:hypothetical protein